MIGSGMTKRNQGSREGEHRWQQDTESSEGEDVQVAVQQTVQRVSSTRRNTSLTYCDSLSTSLPAIGCL